MLGSATVPELDSMWQKLASNPQVLQQMYSLPYIKTVLEGFEANPSLAQQVGVTCQFQVNKSMNCDRKESAVAGSGSFAVTIEMFTTRARSAAREVLFSVVSVCVFVCQCDNSWTVRDIIMKFSKASSHGRKGGHVRKWLYRRVLILLFLWAACGLRASCLSALLYVMCYPILLSYHLITGQVAM